MITKSIMAASLIAIAVVAGLSIQNADAVEGHFALMVDHADSKGIFVSNSIQNSASDAFPDLDKEFVDNFIVLNYERESQFCVVRSDALQDLSDFTEVEIFFTVGMSWIDDPVNVQYRGLQYALVSGQPVAVLDAQQCQALMDAQ